MIKQSKVRCVDMCIYIDENVYKENHDIEKIFDYLCHLFYVFSKKKKFFWTEKDYESFSIYAGSRIYLRLTSPKQFPKEGEAKGLPRIKSVLNYIKKTIYPLKVDYQQEHFGEVIKAEDSPQSDAFIDLNEDLNKDVVNSNNDYVKVDMVNYLASVPRLISKILNELPYSNDHTTIHNLYISCLLTFIRSITLSNENKLRLCNKTTGQLKLNIENLIENIYYEENLNAPVCWNLPEGFKTYVAVLTNRIRKQVCEDIRDLLKLHELSSNIIEDILMLEVHNLNQENIDD